MMTAAIVSVGTLAWFVVATVRRNRAHRLQDQKDAATIEARRMTLDASAEAQRDAQHYEKAVAAARRATAAEDKRRALAARRSVPAGPKTPTQSAEAPTPFRKAIG